MFDLPSCIERCISYVSDSSWSNLVVNSCSLRVFVLADRDFDLDFEAERTDALFLEL